MRSIKKRVKKSLKRRSHKNKSRAKKTRTPKRSKKVKRSKRSKRTKRSKKSKRIRRNIMKGGGSAAEQARKEILNSDQFNKMKKKLEKGEHPGTAGDKVILQGSINQELLKRLLILANDPEYGSDEGKLSMDDLKLAITVFNETGFTVNKSQETALLKAAEGNMVGDMVNINNLYLHLLGRQPPAGKPPPSPGGPNRTPGGGKPPPPPGGPGPPEGGKPGPPGGPGTLGSTTKGEAAAKAEQGRLAASLEEGSESEDEDDGYADAIMEQLRSEYALRVAEQERQAAAKAKRGGAGGKPPPPAGRPGPPAGKPGPPAGRPGTPASKPGPPAGKPGPPVTHREGGIEGDRGGGGRGELSGFAEASESARSAPAHQMLLGSGGDEVSAPPAGKPGPPAGKSGPTGEPYGSGTGSDRESEEDPLQPRSLPDIRHRSWGELTKHEKEILTEFGWNQELWDSGGSPLNVSGEMHPEKKNKLKKIFKFMKETSSNIEYYDSCRRCPPSGKIKKLPRKKRGLWWCQLSPEDKRFLESVGWNQATWDDSKYGLIVYPVYFKKLTRTRQFVEYTWWWRPEDIDESLKEKDGFFPGWECDESGKARPKNKINGDIYFWDLEESDQEKILDIFGEGAEVYPFGRNLFT